jgi:hypothetical protein
MAVAFAALFVAGAGTVEAARLITGKQIKNSSITSTDVRNGSLLRRDFRSGQVPRGPQGLPGAAGRAGRDGFGQVTYATGQVKDVTSGDFFFPCPAGLVPVGGDAYAVDASDDIVPSADIAEYFYASSSTTPNAWGATLGAGAGNVDLIIEAVCANASRTTVSSLAAKTGGSTPAKPLK